MKAKKLKWKYCECGCHQHTASIGDLTSYSIFQHMSKDHKLTGKCRLAIPSHSYTTKEYTSWEAAVAAAQEHANQKLKELGKFVQ